MTIILDTNVVSDLRLPDPDPRLAAWFAAAPEDALALAAFTIAEIEYGIAILPPSRAALAAQLRAWLEGMLEASRILPLDAAAARVLGRMHATPALRHLATMPPASRRPRFGGDLVIAAIAIAAGATVATRNLDDFAAIAAHFPALRALDPATGRSV